MIKADCRLVKTLQARASKKSSIHKLSIYVLRHMYLSPNQIFTFFILNRVRVHHYILMNHGIGRIQFAPQMNVLHMDRLWNADHVTTGTITRLGVRVMSNIWRGQFRGGWEVPNQAEWNIGMSPRILPLPKSHVPCTSILFFMY